MCEIDNGDAIYFGCDPCDVNFDKSKCRVIEYFVVNNSKLVKIDSEKDYTLTLKENNHKSLKGKIKRLIRRK